MNDQTEPQEMLVDWQHVIESFEAMRGFVPEADALATEVRKWIVKINKLKDKRHG